MQKYNLSYDWQDLAEVEIDESEKTSALMKEMLLFWSSGEDRLAENNGNITKAWLKMLGAFLIRNRRRPNDDEGWCDLDGSHGIKITYFTEWEIDEDNIEIESV